MQVKVTFLKVGEFCAEGCQWLRWLRDQYVFSVGVDASRWEALGCSWRFGLWLIVDVGSSQVR